MKRLFRDTPCFFCKTVCRKGWKVSVFPHISNSIPLPRLRRYLTLASVSIVVRGMINDGGARGRCARSRVSMTI